MKKEKLIVLNALALVPVVFRTVVGVFYTVVPLSMIGSLIVLGLSGCIFALPLLIKKPQQQLKASLLVQFWFAHYTIATDWYRFWRDSYTYWALPFNFTATGWGHWADFVVNAFLAVLATAVLIVFLFSYMRAVNSQEINVAPTSQEAYVKLNKLKTLLDQQIITEAEFKEKSAELSAYL